MNRQERFTGCLLGLASGDAVGTTVEFRSRGSFEPLTDMVGGGPFSLEAGQWTDDTSMALCLADSLIQQEQFDPHDQLRRYCDWRANGYRSSTGTCFDIGNTTSSGLSRYERTGDPYGSPDDAYAAGNGSIMRLAPVPMFFFGDVYAAAHHSGLSSRTTHGAVESVDSSRLFGTLLHRALAGCDKEEILFGGDIPVDLAPKVVAIADGDYRDKSRDEISGSGYVINSLEAALWCFLQTDNFRDAILLAVNLGDDADTTGAVCGQIAGAYHADGIPNSP